MRIGLPREGDGVVVWGRSPYAARGEAVATRRNLPLIRVEDAFLRSIRPGRAGDAPLGLLIDGSGVHFDASVPSAMEHLLLTHSLDDPNLLTRAKDGIARLRELDLSKYNIHQPQLSGPPPGYVLVIDQTLGDASVRHSGVKPSVFHEMLAVAQAENPGKRVIIKTHPESSMGLRNGHFGPGDATDTISLLDEPVSPWRLLDGAVAVYTLSSQMGFEAILAGHIPRVFGQPFYAGWGLTRDENPVARRARLLTPTQLFAAAMILAPVWYDPCRDRLCSFEEVVDQLEAETRAFREDRNGYVALGMRMWKRKRLQAVFGREKPLRFTNDPASAVAEASARGAKLLVWAGKEPRDLASAGVFEGEIRRVEDGFLRSRGLGAKLVPPLSLVSDDLGIYYDPSQESRLEHLILQPLPSGGKQRAERLMAQINEAGLTKYNLAGADLPDLPKGKRILVPGQVEDDASILLGGGSVRRNLDLVAAARAANPRAVIIYKPHPDVEAGLRPGRLEPESLSALVDHIASDTDPARLLDSIDEVWTMTSLLGFEALLRAKRVTCLGAPFYAGWGLTHDLGATPERRRRGADGAPLPRPSLAALVHAALIAYPRYFDPVSRLPCPPEVVAHRLVTGTVPHPSLASRILSKLQGRFASHAYLWR